MEPDTLYSIYEDLQSKRNVLQSEINMSLGILDAPFVSKDTKQYHVALLRLKFLNMAALNDVYLNVVDKLFA